jgi:hypothetical protein
MPQSTIDSRTRRLESRDQSRRHWACSTDYSPKSVPFDPAARVRHWMKSWQQQRVLREGTRPSPPSPVIQ